MERFASFDGVELAYRVAGTTDDREPILLLHGFLSDSRSGWAGTGIPEALLGAGHPLLFLDARAHGASAAPREPAAYSGRAMARDLSALLDHLGLRRAGAVGLSLGGFTALECALADGRLTRVAAVGVGRATTTPEEFRRWARSMAADRPSPDDPFRAHAERAGHDRLALAAWLAGAELPQLADDAELASLDRPVLVAAGRDDPLDAEALAAVLPRGRALRVSGDHADAPRAPELVPALSAFFDP